MGEGRAGNGEKFKPSLVPWCPGAAVPGAVPGWAAGSGMPASPHLCGGGSPGTPAEGFAFFPACDFLAVLRGHSKYVARHGDSLKHIKFTDKVSLGLLWRGERRRNYLMFICPEGVLSEEEWFGGTAGRFQGFCSSCGFEELVLLKTTAAPVRDRRGAGSILPALPLKLLPASCPGELVRAPESCFVGNIDLFVVVVPNRNEKCKFLVKQTFLRAVLEN